MSKIIKLQLRPVDWEHPKEWQILMIDETTDMVWQDKRFDREADVYAKLNEIEQLLN